MKVGIITQPLKYNYGGLLQNYALQQILRKNGIESITIDQVENDPKGIRLLLSDAKTFVYKKLLERNRKYFFERKKLREKKGKNLVSFKERFIKCTKPISYGYDIDNYIQKEKFDAFIVGSDQVWRPQYNKFLDNCFLIFSKDYSVRRIAYAASFGTDRWEYSMLQTLRYRKTLKIFDAISVREKSAIGLCETYFGVTPRHVLDPTMLLSIQDYQMIIDTEFDIKDETVDMLVFFLGTSNNKKKIACEIEKKLQPTNRRNIYLDLDTIDEFPSVPQWLNAFKNAKFVVCDSFHATVFSIIFNVDFIVIENKIRGNARFESLLSMFGLEDRLINDISGIEEISNKKIMWDKVNMLMKFYQEESLSFLYEYLVD